MRNIVIALVGLASCGGGAEGVCVYSFKGADVCQDGLDEGQCSDESGTFTAGKVGDAEKACPDKGFSESCGDGSTVGSTMWAKSADDCGVPAS